MVQENDEAVFKKKKMPAISQNREADLSYVVLSASPVQVHGTVKGPTWWKTTFSLLFLIRRLT